MEYIVAGVDPGIVHTGVVMLKFDQDRHVLKVQHRLVMGLDAHATRAELETMAHPRGLHSVSTYIEKYRPRSGFGNDERMVAANAEFKAVIGGTLLRNNGVLRVVSKELMQLLHVWKFSTTSHHQDLRSAARIALLGMLLDPVENKVLYDYVVDNCDGRDWDVHSL
jgi:hypothetical protein